jgi:ATP-dependent helicase/nuclease subunit A
VKQSLAWSYPFGLAPLLPAKSSVTQLTHNNDEFVQRDYGRALDRRPAALARAEPHVCEPFDARLIGTATHLVISQLNLGKSITGEAIQETVSKLSADGAITASVAERIDAASILSFFQSEQGRMALDPSNTVWREWPFSFAFPVEQWGNPGCAGSAKDQMRDTIVVQGIIDMLIRTPGGLAVIDFKTDRVPAEQVAQRAEFYHRQLELYSRAACAILKAELAGTWLYFLNLRLSVAV